MRVKYDHESTVKLKLALKELHCVNRIAMLLLVGLVVGGIDGDGVDVHAFPASSSEETLTHSSQVSFFPHVPKSSSSSIPSSNPNEQLGALGLCQMGRIIRS